MLGMVARVTIGSDDELRESLTSASEYELQVAQAEVSEALKGAAEAMQ